MKSNWNIIERDAKHELVFIEDTSNQMGGMTITNDAEAVLTFFQLRYGKSWQVVYTDTEGEKFLLDWSDYWGVRFTRWEGLAWYLLSKV